MIPGSVSRSRQAEPAEAQHTKSDGFSRGMIQTTLVLQDLVGQFITTSAEVTPNGGLVRESHQNFLKSG